MGRGESATEICEKANRQRIAATEKGMALVERKRMRRRLLPQLQQTPTTTPSRSWLPEIQGRCMHLVPKIGCRRSLSRRQNKTHLCRTCNFRVFMEVESPLLQGLEQKLQLDQELVPGSNLALRAEGNCGIWVQWVRTSWVGVQDKEEEEECGG
ncbi:long chain acyl-CoA synthetase 1 [Pyrus ussuriensis x Pyrus communis]|uniref:Long chain acyl-CoA synthetase 1 n=1 Tax=Pyrus ussuriensis x Pyrus communis TaxID=2448454 RepID=A0A5N5GJ42_9ROSA|nr:long chain acyl-CoA synthetase 1 [Pyrus ussuriensis x Pyrus communis]